MKRNFVLRTISLAAAFSFALFGLVGCGSSSENDTSENDNGNNDTNSKLVIRLADSPAFDSVFWGFAEENGILDKYFSDANVEFEIFSFESGPAMNEAFASNSLDVAVMGDVPSATGCLNQYGYKLVAGSATNNQTCSIVVPADSDIQTLSDLKGKTVGTSIGTQQQYFLGYYLESAGLSIDDVNLINTASETANSIRNGNIDAGTVMIPVGESLAEEGSGRVLIDRHDRLATSFLCVSDTLIDNYPEYVENILKTLEDTYVYALDHQDEYFDYLYNTTGTDVEALRETFFEYNKFHVHEPTESQFNDFKNLIDWMMKNDLIEENDFDVNSFFDLTFIKNINN